jgi:methylenetetrahydrofolate--tRNA-(uracil-5-)-methyltransferase
MAELIIIGGGLAGSEAAWQAAVRGLSVILYEMRPQKLTEAHRTGMLGELVCSNSLRSGDIYSGPGLLKKELSLASSLIMQAADRARVPAGSAVAVNRDLFARYITDNLTCHPNITLVRREVDTVPDSTAIIATGPLTSTGMTDAVAELIGEPYLYFHDAIAPIVDASSIQYDKVYKSSRYGKGGDDYINCPMTKSEYESFHGAVMAADKVKRRDFENARIFEGCMPIEVMAMRGPDTLRFGPMKPVGLLDPRTGREPYAVVQLRTENVECTAYNMVGFQTRLTWTEQKKVFRMIHGLENAIFLRYGSLHRNTFINAPRVLEKDLSLKNKQDIFMAGQLTGVEGYIESTAMGLIAGINAFLKLRGKEMIEVPPATSHGALIRYITESNSKRFQPSNIHFGLFPALQHPTGVKKGKEKRKMIAERAITEWQDYISQINAQ